MDILFLNKFVGKFTSELIFLSQKTLQTRVYWVTNIKINPFTLFESNQFAWFYFRVNHE